MFNYDLVVKTPFRGKPKLHDMKVLRCSFEGNGIVTLLVQATRLSVISWANEKESSLISYALVTEG